MAWTIGHRLNDCRNGPMACRRPKREGWGLDGDRRKHLLSKARLTKSLYRLQSNQRMQLQVLLLYIYLNQMFIATFFFGRLEELPSVPLQLKASRTADHLILTLLRQFPQCISSLYALPHLAPPSTSTGVIQRFHSRLIISHRVGES